MALALGQIVHYLCTETGACQAALVTDILSGGDRPILALNVQRPPIHPNPDPVERIDQVGYVPPAEKFAGSWHYPDDHPGLAKISI